MTKNWFVAQAVRNREIAASMSVVQHGFEAYVPIIQRWKRIGRVPVEVSVPRFGTYIFVRFDREHDEWPVLLRERTQKQYFTRVLCNSDGRPAPVPDQAMQAIRDYVPEPIPQTTTPIIYKPGQRVTCTISGIRREAVFVEYCGKRPFIRTWIFGAERVTEVSSAELEPLDLDIPTETCSAIAR